MNANHYHINSERIWNILMQKNAISWKLRGKKYCTNLETEKSPEITIPGNWWNQLWAHKHFHPSPARSHLPKQNPQKRRKRLVL